MDTNQQLYYLKQLNHQEVEKRREAILNLSAFDDPNVYKVLSSHFSDGHPVIRNALSQVFLENKNRRKAEIVSDALRSPHISAKSLAMEILRNMGSDAVMPLRRLYKSDDADIRKTAVELLGDIDDQSCSQILLEALEDPVQSVRTSVIDGLGKHREIRAVPRLLEYYEKGDVDKSSILKALTKIFLHWEKNIMHPDVFETDPVLASSFINTVQEHGNNSALSLIIHWLERDGAEIGDELLKAISSILKNNPFTTLPNKLFHTIKKNWEMYREDLPVEVYFNCVSRIPSSDALNLLLNFFEQESKTPEIREALKTHLQLFFSIFLGKYNTLDKKLRSQILSMLIHDNIPIYDSEILNFYHHSRGTQEKMAFLQLAAISQHPEAKTILLAKLSSTDRNKSALILENLLHYGDEKLFDLYLKHLFQSEQNVRNIAFRGVIQYPDKLQDYLHKNWNNLHRSQFSSLFDAMFKLPEKLVIGFLEQWLNTERERKEALLEYYLINRKNYQHLSLIARASQDNLSFSTKLYQRFRKELSGGSGQPSAENRGQSVPIIENKMGS
jgi:hypothetical protein